MTVSETDKDTVKTRLSVGETPFGYNESGSPFRQSWTDKSLRSLDGTSTEEFSEEDIAEVLYEGETPDDWDGKVAAVFRLKDGRLVAYETWWGPTGSGFCEDAYGGDAELLLASDLRLVVNELSDEGRRLAGVPEELWNG